MVIWFNCPKCGMGWRGHIAVIADWKCGCGATVADLPPPRITSWRNYCAKYEPPDDPVSVPVEEPK